MGGRERAELARLEVVAAVSAGVSRPIITHQLWWPELVIAVVY